MWYGVERAANSSTADNNPLPLTWGDREATAPTTSHTATSKPRERCLTMLMVTDNSSPGANGLNLCSRNLTRHF